MLVDGSFFSNVNWRSVVVENEINNNNNNNIDDVIDICSMLVDVFVKK